MAEADTRTDADLTIEVREIAKRFGPVVAVDGVSFGVRAGEVVGLLGPNGAGKTTTMRLLTGYYTPDAGRILIKGADTQGRDQEAKAHIGFLPESNPLYSDLLVCEYLRFIADLRGIASAARGGAIDDAVEQAGITEAYYRPIGQLSKGNRQRVGLAQAQSLDLEILVIALPHNRLQPVFFKDAGDVAGSFIERRCSVTPSAELVRREVRQLGPKFLGPNRIQARGWNLGAYTKGKREQDQESSKS